MKDSAPDQAQRWRTMARDMRRRAEQAGTRELRKAWLDAAQAWDDLASERERSLRISPVEVAD
jgi:hypothetical protein